MYKLLPEEQKKIVAQEYGIRRAVVMLAASILVMLLGTAGLFPSYMLSGARRQEVLERARIMGDAAPKEDEAALQGWLSGFNTKLQTLTAFAETAEPTRLIDKVLEEKVAGIRLTGFVWTFAKNKATLAVSGTARDRQALIALELYEKLSVKNEKLVSKTGFPPELELYWYASMTSALELIVLEFT